MRDRRPALRQLGVEVCARRREAFLSAFRPEATFRGGAFLPVQIGEQKINCDPRINVQAVEAKRHRSESRSDAIRLPFARPSCRTIEAPHGTRGRVGGTGIATRCIVCGGREPRGRSVTNAE